MREYSNKITLTQNSRGVYSLDPTLGCYGGMAIYSKGCYNDCYAARYSKKYGYDFSKSVLRDFENESHKHNIIKQIEKIKLPFVRMGTSGDPSDNWEHTIKICKAIQADYQLRLFNSKKKEIVIITRHWNILTNKQLEAISKMNICINTSVSALDSVDLIENSLTQFNRLKPFCKSILRIISCDFNKENKEGIERDIIQKSLFNNAPIIDTVFRCSPSNKFAKDRVINIHKTKFLGKKCYVSKFNKKTYFGKCGSCLEMCGAKIKDNG